MKRRKRRSCRRLARVCYTFGYNLGIIDIITEFDQNNPEKERFICPLHLRRVLRLKDLKNLSVVTWIARGGIGL